MSWPGWSASAASWGTWRRGWAPALRITLLLALAAFYAVGAARHSEEQNVSKARADQTSYLWDAQIVYHNWHGDAPPQVFPRNRMPLYAGFLALFYNPAMSDPDFFALAVKLNIGLSLVLLAAFAIVFSRFLPPLLWMNLTLFVAFGYFVFRAGYVQSELLFYFNFFLAFLACCALFTPRRPLPTLGLGVLCGALLALAHLTKAAVLPFVVVFLATYGGTQVARAIAGLRAGRAPLAMVKERLPGIAAGVLVVVVFLAVLSPYLLTSKRVFRRYFYNVNSTFYVWCENWAQASSLTFRHDDHTRWPHMPKDELPGASKYWREHSLRQIGSRILGGAENMVVRSYETFWYFKYVLVLAALAAWLAWRERRDFAALVRRHGGLVVFLALYAATYLLLIAFYSPISGTGTTRFIQPHIAPLAFVILRLATLPPFDRTSATMAGVRVTTRHLHLLVSVMLAFDIAFTIWPRLMTTYGGF